jgi:DnaJ family protein C protein 28
MSDHVENSAEEQAKQAEHRRRMRSEWHNLIDELIEEGQQQGAFDDLPGKGKPLKLKKNPYAPDLELAHKLLKDNDLTPSWIQERNDLLHQVKTLRAEIQQMWLGHEQAYRLAQGDGQQAALAISWDDTCRKWEAQIGDLNKQISDFNLKRVVDNLEIFKVNLEEELSRVGARRWLR